MHGRVAAPNESPKESALIGARRRSDQSITFSRETSPSLFLFFFLHIPHPLPGLHSTSDIPSLETDHAH